MVPTIEGKASVKIPAGTQNGTTFRLHAKGMPVLNSSHLGDLYVHVLIALPTKLSGEQREALEGFSKAKEESFFKKAKKFFS
jgi:molecular chaperone DnaJ